MRVYKIPQIFSTSRIRWTRGVSTRQPPSHMTMVVSRTPGKEPSQDYTRGGYHPVNVGDIYHNRYTVVQQLGWGRYSTVWLVKDCELGIPSRSPRVNAEFIPSNRKKRKAAMKVLKSNVTEDAGSGDECGILRTLRDTNPKAPGYRHICHLIDDFVHEGPNGPHICIVTELMGPTALDCYQCVPGAMPLHFVKRVTKQMLLALQYIHDECHIVHTGLSANSTNDEALADVLVDIKGDNIFMRGAPPPTHPLAQKFEQDELMSASFKLGDFGTGIFYYLWMNILASLQVSANRMSNRYAKLIQAEALRAPEVILDAQWDTKADIWNIGALVSGSTTLDNLSDISYRSTNLLVVRCFLIHRRTWGRRDSVLHRPTSHKWWPC